MVKKLNIVIKDCLVSDLEHNMVNIKLKEFKLKELIISKNEIGFNFKTKFLTDEIIINSEDLMVGIQNLRAILTYKNSKYSLLNKRKNKAKKAKELYGENSFYNDDLLNNRNDSDYYED